MKRREYLMLGASLAVLLVVGLFAGLQYFDSSEHYYGTLVEAGDSPEDFTLTSAAGDVNLSDYRGQLVVMYFGYTSCPDFCPATLSKLDRVQEQLGDDAEDVQVMMVSVDPERDTPEKLEQFVQTFNADFVGVTGDDSQIQSVASQFGIFYQKQPGSEATGYLVDHTTHLVVVDRDGHARLYLPWDLNVDQVENDLKNLL